MSPRTRRRSARLAGAVSKGKRAPELPAVAECNGSSTQDELQQLRDVSPPVRSAPSTPKSSLLKPPHGEMHPSKVHQSTGEPSSALRLGFFDIPSEADVRRGCPPKTPSKVTGIPSSSFTFSAPRDTAEPVLSGEAQLMMHDLRLEAAKHKAEMIANREAAAETMQTDGRVIARPTGKAGRFSAAHMAQFKKMDSIEGHASAWRAQAGRFTPLKSALKRSPSKANLDGATTSVGESDLNKSVTKTQIEGTPNPRLKSGLKRAPSAANLDPRPTSKGSDGASLARKLPTGSRTTFLSSNSKRLKQGPTDDISDPLPITAKTEITGNSSESVSDRAPNPARSVTLSGSNTVRKPTITMVPSSSKKLVGFARSMLAVSDGGPDEGSAGLMKPLGDSKPPQGDLSSKAQDQGLNGLNSGPPKPKTALSRTPVPTRNRTALPIASFTTPRRKMVKRVAFTPEMKREALLQDSPSPKRVETGKSRAPLQAISSYELTGQEAGAIESKADGSLYPDLSPLKRLVASSPEAGKPQSSAVPGAFTFRSDRTIEFGECVSTGFGNSPGQASVRHVQVSSFAKAMPGSFPALPPPSAHSDKENTAPAPATTGLLPGTAHGMPNKKRHRAASDEEDSEAEAAKRAAKRRRNEGVAEGQALLAPRVVNGHSHGTLHKNAIRTPGKSFMRSPGKTPFRTTARTPSTTLPSVSPSKKGATLSMRRLQMLAQPKRRV